MEPRAPLPVSAAASKEPDSDTLAANGIELASIDAETAPIEPDGTRPRWWWPLVLGLTTLLAMVVGWYATSLASRWLPLP